MTSKERWLASLRLEPIDRLAFWPKIWSRAYTQAQVLPFRDMSVPDMHAWFGSDQFPILPHCTREVRTDTSFRTFENGGTRKTVYETRWGSTALIERFDAASQAWYPVQYPVQNVEDIRLLTEVYADCSVEVDENLLEEAEGKAKAIGEMVATHSEVISTPLMFWVRELASLEVAHYFLSDYPQEVEALFDALQMVQLRKMEIECGHNPSDVLMIQEDTSTTLVSPQQFRKYCVPALKEYGCLGQAAERTVMCHMCGKLKALLPDMANLPVTGFEAFTSAPVGDTTLLDGRTECPEKCLIGGTNASLWMRSAEEIIAEIERDLDTLPHHRGIIVSAAGVMTPLCSPETIKAVCDWVKQYRARF